MPHQDYDPILDVPITNAGPIAKELFGEDTDENRRRVYYIAEQQDKAAEKNLPVIRKMGRALITTRRALLKVAVGEQTTESA
jgi:hypothetical protein